MSTTSTKSSNTSSSEDDNTNELRRGPWTIEEDTILIHYIACHGEGRWNLLAKRSGLRRTGKSCRLRWLNYLKPDVKRGNLTPEEQLLILDLHSKWGNRWSKIAQYLPGRTDNEIKNYWRTRVQKQAKHLKIDAESAAFQDIIRRFWMPRLIQKIEGPSASIIPIALNPIAPMPLDDTSQEQHISSLQQSVLRHENAINMSGLRANSEQYSDSEWMNNMSQTSHFSEYPNGSFQQMVSVINNDQNTTASSNNNTSTFLEGCCYDMDDVFSHSTSVSQGKGLENPDGGVCHVEGGDWVDNDFFASVWNMEELLQHKS